MTTINATNTPQLTTNGQLIIGSTSAFPVAANITPGTGISVTNGAGTITLASTVAGGIGQGAISGNYYISNAVFGIPGNSGANSVGNNITVSTLYFYPYFNTKSTTYTKIGFYNNGATLGTSVMGIYNDNGNAKPTGTPITNSNSTSVTNTAGTFIVYTFSSPITLAAGVYWLAFSSSSGSITLIGPQIPFPNGMGNSSTPTFSNYNTACQIGWSQSFAYSATLPTVGSLTSVTLATNGRGTMWLVAQ